MPSVREGYVTCWPCSGCLSMTALFHFFSTWILQSLHWIYSCFPFLHIVIARLLPPVSYDICWMGGVWSSSGNPWATIQERVSKHELAIREINLVQDQHEERARQARSGLHRQQTGSGGQWDYLNIMCWIDVDWCFLTVIGEQPSFLVTLTPSASVGCCCCCCAAADPTSICSSPSRHPLAAPNSLIHWLPALFTQLWTQQSAPVC